MVSHMLTYNSPPLHCALHCGISWLVERDLASSVREGKEKKVMGNQTATNGLDFEAMRRAIEERDAEALIGFYAEDAELHTVNRNSTPSSPQVLRGKEHSPASA